MEAKVICWFSCGANSAVAAKLACTENPDTVVVYCNTMANEHPDNRRFLGDVEGWIGKKVTIISSEKYSTVEEVFSDRRYMSGIAGAPCTAELKKIPRFKFQTVDDTHIFGYSFEEQPRIDRFVANNPELNLYWILQKYRYTKRKCLAELQKAKIAVPTMYKLGYRNNNCLGCVKATSPKYWAMIRRDFPETFKKRAEQSRELNVRLVRIGLDRIFLDELPDDSFKHHKQQDLFCGPECGG